MAGIYIKYMVAYVARWRTMRSGRRRNEPHVSLDREANVHGRVSTLGRSFVNIVQGRGATGSNPFKKNVANFVLFRKIFVSKKMS